MDRALEEQVADGTIDGLGATDTVWATEAPDVRAAIRQAARELLHAAPYGSLVLWGGRLVHGLRFASIAAASTGFAPDPYALAAQGLFEQLDLGASPRLVMLVPFSVGRLIGTEDQACRFQVCGPVAADGCEWVSVALAGWATQVSDPSVSEVALAFAERHPTPDLLDLGSAWMLLEIDIAEATVRTRSGCIRLDTDDALDLLHDRAGDAGHGRDGEPDRDHVAGGMEGTGDPGTVAGPGTEARW